MVNLFKGNDDISHTYLICRFGHCMLIDPSHGYEEILSKLGDQALDGILITHAHNDHVDLIGSFNCPVYIHEDDASLLFDDKYNGYGPNKRPFKRKELDLRLLKDLDEIALGDTKVTCYHTPGHTKGSVSFLFDNHLFTGDTLFKHDVGRHDLLGGNLFDLKRSIIHILDNLNANIKVCPGHDDMTTIREEKKSNPFYIKWKKQGKI